MFQSIKFIKSLGFVGSEIEALYKITDTNFEEEVVVLSSNGNVSEVIALIQVYEQKNLNVAKNLLLYFRQLEGKHKGILRYPLRERLLDFLTSNPNFKYKETVENYLLLI
jgi:hypothetical protein